MMSKAFKEVLRIIMTDNFQMGFIYGTCNATKITIKLSIHRSILFKNNHFCLEMMLHDQVFIFIFHFHVPSIHKNPLRWLEHRGIPPVAI